jgi:hypothetical protein
MESPDGLCTEPDRKRIDAQRKFWSTLGWSLGLPGAGLLALGGSDSMTGIIPTPPGFGAVALVETVLGLGLYLGGLACYARYKNLPVAWGLLGFGCLVGLLILRCLPKLCRHCDFRNPSGGFDCLNCRAPI